MSVDALRQEVVALRGQRASAEPEPVLDPVVRELLESVPGALTLSSAVRDSTGRVVDLRPRFMNAAARARGPRWPTLDDESFAACLRTLDTGVSEHVEFTWTDDGSERPAAHEFVAVRVGTDGLLWIVLDEATERQRRARTLEESEARFRAAFDHSPAGTCIVDLEGRVTTADAEFARLLGARRKRWRG